MTGCHEVPCHRLFKYPWRIPYDVNRQLADDDRGSNAFSIGDEVWVKPSVPSCTKPWAPGRVTAIQSKHTICIDGMPRHVHEVRRRRGPVVNDDDDSSSEDEWPMQADGVDKGPVTESTPALQDPESPLPLVEEDERVELERPVVADVEASGESVTETPVQSPRRSSRVRWPPRWLQDYAS